VVIVGALVDSTVVVVDWVLIVTSGTLANVSITAPAAVVVVIVNVPVAPDTDGLPTFVNVIVIAPAGSAVPSFSRSNVNT